MKPLVLLFALLMLTRCGMAQGILYREEADRWVIDIVRSDRAIGPFQLDLTALGETGVKLAGCRVTKSVLYGGKQEGVELVEIDNGLLRIVVIPTRGLSIFEVVRRDGDRTTRLGWNSPVKEKVHPQFMDLESRGGLGWLEGFNEWMVRCGLEFAGHPGLDRFTTNTGDTAEMMLTLHGKVGNIPASDCSIIIDKTTQRIAVRGTVHERLFFGPKLKLVAEVSTTLGSDAFRIQDTVSNEGGADQEFQLIYHANYGDPLLGLGAKLHAATETVTPMNAHAAGALAKWNTYAAPTPGFIEEVFLLKPIGDAEGRTLAVLQSGDQQTATSVRWNTKELGFLTLWKNTTDQRDGYVTGIEPATGYPYNRSVERTTGRLPVLKPGEARSFTLEFGIHTDATAIKDLVAEVDRLQGKTPRRMVPNPPEVPAPAPTK